MATQTKILIVDDEPINLKLVANVLKDSYQIAIARSGAEALDYMARNRVDLVLLDIHMPDMNGFDVLRHIRANQLTIAPIIVLTADKSPEVLVSAFNLGAVDYVSKPFQNEELISRVNNRLQTSMLQSRMEALLRSNTKLISIVNSYVSYVRMNTLGVIQEVSHSFCENLHVQYHEVVGKDIRSLAQDNETVIFYDGILQAQAGKRTCTTELQMMSGDGNRGWYHVSVSPEYDDHGKGLMGFVLFYQNIDDKIKYQREAQTDALTGLLNRSCLNECLRDQVHRVEVSAAPLCILLMDIDHFKAVNDMYGHQVGDSLLKEMTAIISAELRATDLFGRWGGEEFIIITPNSDIEIAVSIAERLRSVIAAHHFDVVGEKTVSFGVAKYLAGEGGDRFFQRVDLALYQAKNNGRNQIRQA